jgi:hypothetical protein
VAGGEVSWHQYVPARTTITFDEDVRAKLETQMRKSGKSFNRLGFFSGQSAHKITEDIVGTVSPGWCDRDCQQLAVASHRRPHGATLAGLEQVASKDPSYDHLAALAIEHGATLYTNDLDFARFRG